MGLLQGLCCYNNLLYAAWKGETNDDRLFYDTFNGTTWKSQEQIFGVASSIGPSLATFQNKIYAAWRGDIYAACEGDSGDQRLWYASFDGSKWSTQAQIPSVASSIGPSLAVFDNKLYASWKGEGSDQSLWYASFDGLN
jgi:hypothetical protein